MPYGTCDLAFAIVNGDHCYIWLFASAYLCFPWPCIQVSEYLVGKKFKSIAKSEAGRDGLMDGWTAHAVNWS